MPDTSNPTTSPQTVNPMRLPPEPLRAAPWEDSCARAFCVVGSMTNLTKYLRAKLNGTGYIF